MTAMAQQEYGVVDITLPDGVPLDLADCSARVLQKAKTLCSSVKMHATEPSDGAVVGKVPGSTGGSYDVMLGIDSEKRPIWALCSCPWGKRNQDGSMGCSHQAAVFMVYCEEAS